MATEINTPSATPYAGVQNATPDAMPFRRDNYLWMIIGVVTILVGFLVMSLDKEEFGFGFLGLTLGPIIVVAGYIIEFYALLKKSKA